MKIKLSLAALLITTSARSQEIGLQLYSLRKQIPTDVKGTLALIKSWGITELEGGDMYGMSRDEFLMLCRQNGLSLVSIGADFEKLKSDPQSVIDLAQDLGVETVVCYWLPHSGKFTVADADSAITVLNRAGRKLAKYGIRLFYHTYSYEFVPASMSAMEFKARQKAAEIALIREKAYEEMEKSKSEEGRVGGISNKERSTQYLNKNTADNSSQSNQSNENASEQSSASRTEFTETKKIPQETAFAAQAGYTPETLFDYMVAMLDKDAVNFELDVYWVKHAGVDPIALMKKYPSRFKIVHLKDRKTGTQSLSVSAIEGDYSVTLGTGDVNIAEVMRVGKEIGVERYFIEDESPRVLEQIPQSIKFLKSLKY